MRLTQDERLGLMADKIEKKANREGTRIRPLKLTFPTDARKPIIEDNADALDDLSEANLLSKEISSPSLSEEVPPISSPEVILSSISPEILPSSSSKEMTLPSKAREAIPESLTHEDEHEDKIASYTLLELEEDTEDEGGMTAFSPPASPKQETAPDKKTEKIRVPLGRLASSEMDVLFSSRVSDSSESDMPVYPVDRRITASVTPSITSPDATTAASSTRPPLRRIPASRRVSESDLVSAESEMASTELYTEDALTIAVPVPKVPLRFKTLDEAMGSLRDLHLLPTETLFAQESYQFTWLRTQIRKIATNTGLQEFALSLTQRDLSLLFSTLSQLKKREETEPIQNLIRLRAGHCLYIYGWITFQYCYPRSTLARALADLCKILEDISFVKENAQDDDRGGSQSNDSVKNRMDLPEIDIGEGRVIWSRVPLISGIAFPNSRHFISDLANHIFESNISLEAFYRRYAIYPGLPLSDAIESRYKEKVTGDSQNPFLSSTFFDRFRS